jgi:hypothetical protein
MSASAFVTPAWIARRAVAAPPLASYTYPYSKPAITTGEVISTSPTTTQLANVTTSRTLSIIAISPCLGCGVRPTSRDRCALRHMSMQTCYANAQLHCPHHRPTAAR